MVRHLLGEQALRKGLAGSTPVLSAIYDNMSLLTHAEIQKELKDLPGWQLDDKFLRKEFIFPTFTDAMVFVNEVAQAAEDFNHHPDISIHHNTVKLSTTTYEDMGITDKDIEIARRAQETEKVVFGELSKA